MKKIIFICPYFGKLPYQQMILWLNSCKYNKNIKWIVITDDVTKFELPNNVVFLYKTLEELKNEFQKKFDFKISLEHAYKLCDYKPLYGYLFEDLVNGYDYWGHCDITDCIFGDLELFLNYKNIKKYDKIFFLGHMTIYRNNSKINKRFFLPTSSNKTLEDILGTNENMAFDEINNYSINQIYKEYGFSLKRMDYVYSDISCKSYEFITGTYDSEFKFKRNPYVPMICYWENGKLYNIYIKNNIIIKKEIGYVHYQKRKMKCNLNLKNIDRFLIVPSGFIECNENINKELIRKYSKRKLIYLPFFKLKYKSIKVKIKRYIKK